MRFAGIFRLALAATVLALMLRLPHRAELEAAECLRTRVLAADDGLEMPRRTRRTARSRRIVATEAHALACR